MTIPPAPYAYRRDPSVPAFDDSRPVVVFDGMCVLCSRTVQFLLRADARGRLRFLAAQAPLGQALYRHFGLRPGDLDTYALIADGRAYVKSDASLRILSLLGPPWSLAAAARLVPQALRDWVYDGVAANRLRWFGARAQCFAPDPAIAERFLQ